MTVTPDDKSTQATWYCSMIAKQSFDAHASDAAFLQNDLAYLKEEAAKAGSSLSTYLATKILTGTKTVPFTGLTASTDYYAYVYGITAAGEITSPLFKQLFSTPAGPEPEKLTFEFSVTNITKFAADIDVTPSNDTDTYYFDVAPVKAFEGMTDEEILADVIDGLTADDLSQGPDGLPAELIEYYTPFTPGTDYYVYAVGFDMDKGATTQLFKYQFTTEEATGEAPQVTIDFMQGDENGDNPSTMLTFTVLAPGTASGRAVLASKSEVDALLAKGATLDDLVTYNGDPLTAEELAKVIVEPGLPITYIKLTPATEYTFIVKATGEGGKSTVERYDGTTAEGGPTSDLTFQITADNPTYKGFDLNIVPSDLEATYFWGVFGAGLLDQYAGKDAELIAALIKGNTPAGGTFADACDKGVISLSLNTLKASTDYAVICFGYANGAATTGTTSVKISTLAKPAVTSTLFDELPGEWTATLTTEGETSDEQSTFDLTIAGGVDDATKALYRAENWLVGFGSIYFQNYYSPADLVSFGWPEADAQLDYGPKMFFEIHEGDVVTVLADMTNLFLNWNSENLGEVYLLGLDPAGMKFNTADGNAFPVTVSEDKNTLTINPLVIAGVNYYPSILGLTTNWSAYMIGKSAMTLTRKTEGPASVKGSSAATKFGNLRPVRSSAPSAVAAVNRIGTIGSLSSVIDGSIRSASPAVGHFVLREPNLSLDAGSAPASLRKRAIEMNRPHKATVRTPRP